MSRVFRRDGDYWIDFNDAKGVRHRKKIGPSKRIAKEVLDGMLGNVARRMFLSVIDDSPISFEDFATKVWWERIEQSLQPRSKERWLGILNAHLIPFFKGSLRSVTAADAQRYVADRLKPSVCGKCDGKKMIKDEHCTRCAGTGEIKACPSTVNRELTVLKHILKRAVAWEYITRNPFRDGNGNLVDGLRTLKESKGRVRFLTEEEIERLISACDEALSPYLGPFAVVALNTGMRRNEILSLTRDSIDWQNHAARLEKTKNGEARDVPLNSAAIDAIRSLPARIDGKLFALNPNQVTMMFGRAVKRAKISNFRLHDLRHTFASYQAMNGVQPRGLQSLLGHKDNRMTMRYSHLSDDYLKKAVNAVVLGARPAKPANPQTAATA